MKNNSVQESSFKEINDIRKLLNNEKISLIEKMGESKGISLFKQNYLNKDKSTEVEMAKSIYQLIRYSTLCGVHGENVSNDFFKETFLDTKDHENTKSIIKQVQFAIIRMLPNASKEFALNVVEQYRSETIKQINKSKINLVDSDEQIRIINNFVPKVERNQYKLNTFVDGNPKELVEMKIQKTKLSNIKTNLLKFLNIGQPISSTPFLKL
jgi:uncharacterized protein YwgA